MVKVVLIIIGGIIVSKKIVLGKFVLGELFGEELVVLC